MQGGGNHLSMGNQVSWHQSWQRTWLLYQYHWSYIYPIRRRGSCILDTRWWSEAQICEFNSERYPSCPSNKEQSTSANYSTFDCQMRYHITNNLKGGARISGCSNFIIRPARINCPWVTKELAAIKMQKLSKDAAIKEQLVKLTQTHREIGLGYSFLASTGTMIR